MQKAVVLDKISLAPSDLDLTAWHELPISWREFDLTSAQKTLEHIDDAEIVLANKVVLDRDVLRAAPNIKLVVILATGTNNIDLVAAKELGITVCHMVAYSTESVAQQVFAMLLASATRWPDYDAAIKAGQWQESDLFCLLNYPIVELAEQTLGIVGYGAIGKRVAELAKAFNMKVLVAKSMRKNAAANSDRLALAELLPKCDYLTLHCPLTDQTKNLISKTELALLKPSAFLVNMARGGVVHEHDLADALRTGKLKGAAVDVLMQEPPGSDNPLLANNIPNLLMTPHTAWASRQARQEIIRQTAEILNQWCASGSVEIQRAA